MVDGGGAELAVIKSKPMTAWKSESLLDFMVNWVTASGEYCAICALWRDVWRGRGSDAVKIGRLAVWLVNC